MPESSLVASCPSSIDSSLVSLSNYVIELLLALRSPNTPLSMHAFETLEAHTNEPHTATLQAYTTKPHTATLQARTNHTH
jgi:hypothetical protein